jgi:hypothetical protein
MAAGSTGEQAGIPVSGVVSSLGQGFLCPGLGGGKQPGSGVLNRWSFDWRRLQDLVAAKEGPVLLVLVSYMDLCGLEANLGTGQQVPGRPWLFPPLLWVFSF